MPPVLQAKGNTTGYESPKVRVSNKKLLTSLQLSEADSKAFCKS